MPRRIIFAGVILSLAIFKYLGKKAIFVCLYLAPIVLANILLYSKGSPFVQSNYPSGQVLIETHYLHPFTKYNGTILWVGSDDLERIDGYLENGKRIFMTKQAATAPYLLLVGNNYHITSVGKIGNSDSRYLFKKYTIEPFGDSYELKLFRGKVSEKAGEQVVFYDQNFWGRLVRRRIDYGDVGVWLWVLLTNHRDPTGWIYKDATGAWVSSGIKVK